MNRCFFLFILFLLFGNQFVGLAQIDTDKVMKKGRDELAVEDYVLSIQYFNKVIRVKPLLAEPYYLRAIAKYYLDDFKGAELDCDKALSINPFMIDAFNLKGIIAGKMGDSKGAVAAYSDGLKVESTYLNLLFNRGISYITLKDYTKAIEDYNELLKYDSSNLGALNNRGLAKLESGDTLGCTEDFNKMVAINTYSVDSYTTRGMFFYKQRKYDLALSDLNKAIEYSPIEKANLFLDRGVILSQMDDLRGSMADFDKVIALDPKNGMAYTDRGALRAQVGDLNRAIEDFSRVLALDPSDMMIVLYRAELFLQTRQYAKALNDYNIVAEQYPKYSPLYFSRARVKQALNDTRGAQLDYNTAQKLDYDKSEREKMADKNDPIKTKSGTRKKSDRNLTNYNRLAVLDDFEDFENEPVVGEVIKGKVQNRDISINLESVFGLSFFTVDSVTNRRPFFNARVVTFNKRKVYDMALVFTNRELEDDGFNVNTVSRFDGISALSSKIEADTTNSDLRLARAVLYASVLNFNSAIADYDHILAHNPLNALAYFNRAYARFQMVEIIKTLRVDNSSGSLSRGFMPNGIVDKGEVKESKFLDYDLVVSDLDKVISLDGSFEFAYYNRGCVRSMNHDYEGALADFSKAIEINPYFAEAFYNRGLTLIFLHQEDQGTFDLSKAGELGLYKAYNVIKRYGGTQAQTDDSDK